MRLFRLFVVVATLLSLPGYALAATGHAGGCPGRAAGGAGEAQVSHTAVTDLAGTDMAAHGTAMQHECCPGTSDPQPPTAPYEGCPGCLAGHGCQGAQGAEPPAGLLVFLLPQHAAVIDEPSPHASLCGPDGLLRPPDRS